MTEPLHSRSLKQLSGTTNHRGAVTSIEQKVRQRHTSNGRQRPYPDRCVGLAQLPTNLPLLRADMPRHTLR